MQPFNKNILINFIEKFYGYGNYKSPIWFVGMEPGAPKERKKIKKFFDVWKDRGELETDNVRESHLEIGIKHYTELFSDNPKYQRTWGSLIKILFYANGKSNFTIDDIKDYQKDKLGQKNSDHCLIELLPLPSYSTTTWQYSNTGIKELKDRDTYESYYIPRRIIGLRNRIKTHVPRVVIFYSLKYKMHWERLVDKGFILYDEIDNRKIWYAELGKTLYLIIAQPSQGVSNKYLYEVSELVKKHLNK
ncbi:MAG: hypothetical protein A2315_13080 [Ignavibacteria bacterium RIFOXYB2_FULL_35_12]|nr:MAG: hypothetical protein A2X60_07620 [Ignavibacteria bacterium GWF2_35_20]OGU82672.1 MAG: hypothetical protein A2254_15170 [Ignavibacteria bacterium RIFOXYA2_FULL_35_9]OGU88253.1 MAG: hypothetical protein A3K31_10000 [Ignavibacteria bacterium RIFOXYA12_FULL_35_25]OGU91259.1 MAG: hypothetical protein A2492_03730 [Ignavibacteria bacterium RIFOXYC12_FULL_35_11]OGU93201.1 MAG: hypothetical protein A2347_08245 [Ignavibacteria bacterium RIFOXYB12_FULL_35_14]OGU99174.1 MAG: hypothetical protein A